MEEKEKKEERKEQKPVVKGQVKIKKEPLSRKFSNVFLSDTVDNVKSYIIFDVIVPGIRDLIYSMITNGSDMLIYGRSGGNKGSGGGSKRDYTKFTRGSSGWSNNEPRRGGNPRDRHAYNDIIFDNRGDAREVLDCMSDILERFKMVSVADFYELAHAEECETYADRKYGWYDLSGADIARDRDGYRIIFPKTELLD